MTERRDSQDRKKLIKEAMKEAMKEWLDEKAMIFGRWSLRTIGAVLVVATIYFMLAMNGWGHLPTATHTPVTRQ